MVQRTEERKALRLGQCSAALNDHLLCTTARSGLIEELRELLASGIMPSACDQRGIPALVSASAEGHADCVQLLLDSSAAVNARGPHNMSALTMACCNGHTRCVQKLIAAAQSQLSTSEAAKLLSSKSEQLTPGELALANGHIHIAQLIGSALEQEVRPAPPSRLMWQGRREDCHQLIGPPSKVRLSIAALARRPSLRHLRPHLMKLSTALHLYLADLPQSDTPGHKYDAACAKDDLPSLPDRLPESIVLFQGVRLGIEARPRFRARVLACKQQIMADLLQPTTAPHCVALRGDRNRDFNHGMVRIVFTVDYRGKTHELFLVHWMVQKDAQFAGAEDEDENIVEEEEEEEEVVVEEEEEGAVEYEYVEQDENYDDDAEVLDVSDSEWEPDESETDDNVDDEEEAGVARPAISYGPESEVSEEETDEETEADDFSATATRAAAAAMAPDDSCHLKTLVYQHLPASQRQKNDAERQGRKELSHATRNFYQVMSIQDILFRTPLWPVDLFDIEQPKEFYLNADMWGLSGGI